MQYEYDKQRLAAARTAVRHSPSYSLTARQPLPLTLSPSPTYVLDRALELDVELEPSIITYVLGYAPNRHV
jgi:hypothetical protein